MVRTAAEPGLELICRMEDVVKTRRHRNGIICGGSPDKPINEDLRGAAMQLHVCGVQTVAVEGEKGSPVEVYDGKGVPGAKNSLVRK